MSDLTVFRDHCRREAKAAGPTDAERALWIQLADEIDAYLTGDPDDPLPVIDDDQLNLLEEVTPDGR